MKLNEKVFQQGNEFAILQEVGDYLSGNGRPQVATFFYNVAKYHKVITALFAAIRGEL